MTYVASIRRDGRTYRRRIRVYIVPLDDGLVWRLKQHMGREVEVVVEDVPVRCTVTQDDGAVALRPIEDDRQKVLRILRRGRRFVRVSLP